MQELKFVNAKGDHLKFDLFGPYIFWNIEGLDIPRQTFLQSQAVGQHGFTYKGGLFESREIVLTGHIHGKKGIQEMYELRQQLNSILNPLYGLGKLIYTNDKGTYLIGAICSQNPYLRKTREVQTLKIHFLCPSPFFEGETKNEIKLAYVDGGLNFPVQTPNLFGTLGYRVFADNDGDSEVPLEIFIDGGALNPILKNCTTKEFLKVSKEMKPSEKLYINTDPEQMEVSIQKFDGSHQQWVKENAFGYLSTDSSMLKLQPGKNEITFLSDDQNKKIKVRLIWQKRYVGI